jgi:hypothetical protein
MKYDLHMHTTCSDGKYSRLELLKKINELNFEYCCFTDHNYFADDITFLEKEYEALYGKQQVKIFNGVELDISEYPRLHILGYDIKKAKALQQKLEQLEIENTNICKELLKKIYAHYAIQIPFEELSGMTINGNVTKNIVVQWLIDNGYARNVYEAGMLYTSKYSPCYVERSTLKLQEAFDLLHSANALIVMAHPSSLKLSNEELYRFVWALKEKGLNGIEVFNADKTTPEQCNFYRELANKFKLYETSGSDFHRESETPILGVNNDYSTNFIRTLKRRT